MEAEWRLYPSVNKANISQDNAVSPDKCKYIILDNAGLLLVEPVGTKSYEFR